MTTDKELLLAVLSMDSYNRGYEPGIQDLGEAGTKVGKATIIDVDLPVNAQSNGFYAAAYAVDGEIVIAYRGSDDLMDAWNDFQSIALGPTGVIPRQVELAAQFYQSVKNANPDKAIVLTGHSLGGALAGIIAKINAIEAVIFNNISFENVAQNVFYYASLTDEQISIIAAIGSDYQALVDKRTWARDTFYGGQAPTALNDAHIKSLETPDDVARIKGDASL